MRRARDDVTLGVGRSASPTSAPRAGRERESGAEVLGLLRDDIRSGVLRPQQRLKFEELRERYQGSIASLREALLHLTAEGMVSSEPNRGFAVAPVSLSDFLDITELRIQFEVQALSNSIKRGDDAWEAEIVTSLHLLLKTLNEGKGTRSEEWPARHRRFHQALVNGCRSPWLLHFRSVLFDQAERYRSLGRIYRRSPRNVGPEHKALAEAVLARDVSKSCLLAEKHIRTTAENVISNVPDLQEARTR